MAAILLLGPGAELRGRFGHRRRCKVGSLWPRRLPSEEEPEHRPMSGLGLRSGVLRRQSCRQLGRRDRLRLGLRRQSPGGRRNQSIEGSRQVRWKSRCRPAVCSALQVMQSSAAVTYQWCCKRSREEDGHGGCSGCCELHDGNRSKGLKSGSDLCEQCNGNERKTTLNNLGCDERFMLSWKPQETPFAMQPG